MNQSTRKAPPTKIDPRRLWAVSYQLLSSVIAEVAPDIEALGLEVKELFLLAELDEHPYPAELAKKAVMPKATVTVYVKRLEAAGFLRREIDKTDLRKHRLEMTPAGRKAATRGIALLSETFARRIARLDAQEQRALEALLDKLA